MATNVLQVGVKTRSDVLCCVVSVGFHFRKTRRVKGKVQLCLCLAELHHNFRAGHSSCTWLTL